MYKNVKWNDSYSSPCSESNNFYKKYINIEDEKKVTNCKKLLPIRSQNLWQIINILGVHICYIKKTFEASEKFIDLHI